MTSRPGAAARVAAFLAVLTIVIAACGSTVSPTQNPNTSSAPASGSAQPPILPIQVTSFFHVGDNRVIFGLADSTGQKAIATPDRTLTVGFNGPSGQAIPPAPMSFIWALQPVNGVYVGHATFPASGKWTADFTTTAPGSPSLTMTFGFDVLDRSPVVSVGDPAPSVKTPTLADVGGDVAKISSDPNPVKRFYETSEDAAVAARKPFVLIFATPKFCQTATCGPTLDRLKPVAAAHPELTFINVEPYKLKYQDGGLQADLDPSTQALVPVQATEQWGLISEPWVFVVDRQGIVRGSFGLIFSDDELKAALDAVK